MTWSLSKDDDGLDGITPAEPARSPIVDSAAPRRVGFRSDKDSAIAPSIVVERSSPFSAPPLAQPIAQPLAQQPVRSPRAKRAAEPTLVLKTRRLDELRDEVKKHRAVQVQSPPSQAKALLLWAVAGGAALSLGVFVAQSALGPSDSASSTEASFRLTDSNDQAAIRAADTSLKAASKESSTAKPETDSEAESKKSEAAATDAPADKALTLDDLPLE